MISTMRPIILALSIICLAAQSAQAGVLVRAESMDCVLDAGISDMTSTLETTSKSEIGSERNNQLLDLSLVQESESNYDVMVDIRIERFWPVSVCSQQLVSQSNKARYYQRVMRPV